MGIQTFVLFTPLSLSIATSSQEHVAKVANDTYDVRPWSFGCSRETEEAEAKSKEKPQ